MATIISTTNAKGGVGKSSTALFLAYALKEKGKTLLIDMDAQNSLTSFFFDEVDSILGKTIFEALTGKIDINDSVYTFEPNLDFIPADILLTTFSDEPIDLKELRLNEILKPILSQYEYVIIDTAPNLLTETKSALGISNIIIIPTILSSWAVRSVDIVDQFIDSNNIKRLQSATNTDFQKAYILPTLVEKNRVAQDAVLSALKEDHGERVLDGISKKTDVEKLYIIKDRKEIPKLATFKEYKKIADSILVPSLVKG
jgi:chromosome partitioning protein|tara:strand:+ start:6799 stop:7569 length:771 start_codon:yes stop_codon:yes gene_type:complete